MKKAYVITGLILTALVLFCLFFVQPLKVQNEDHYRWTVQLGKTVYLDSIADMSGGYRCYVNDGTEYFWLSKDQCEIQYYKNGILKVVFRVGKDPIIYRKGT